MDNPISPLSNILNSYETIIDLTTVPNDAIPASKPPYLSPLPRVNLPILKKFHPLDVSISMEDINYIKCTFQCPFNDTIISMLDNPLPKIDTESSRHLIWHGSPITDAIIHHFLLFSPDTIQTCI